MQSALDSVSHPSATSVGRVVSVNIGRPRTIAWRDGTLTSAIWKQPVAGPVAVQGVNLAGDDQADREVHGGPDKAVYAYALDDYQFWQDELGVALEPGSFGENLTIDGLAVSHARIGERWQVGSAVLEVSQPRIPCYKLGVRMQDPAFPRRFAAAGRPGAYLRILREGLVAAGDAVTVVYRPEHELTAALVARAYHTDRSLLPKLLEVPELAAGWRDWAERLITRRAPQPFRAPPVTPAMM
jgi:MOSC domain-containing protein YiiM